MAEAAAFPAALFITGSPAWLDFTALFFALDAGFLAALDLDFDFFAATDFGRVFAMTWTLPVTRTGRLAGSCQPGWP
jgi:hypothetical protein